MKPIDIILIVGLAVVVVGVIAHLIYRKKKGINGCGCGCKNCPSASSCGAKKEECDGEERKTLEKEQNE